YGDWLAYDYTEPRYIAICYYACDSMLMEAYSRQLSEGVGNYYDGRVAYYESLTAKIKAHFCDLYLGAEGLTQQSQTACLLALKFKMLPEEWIEPTKALLRKKIVENGYRLSTGFVGTGALMTTLSEYGMDDLCYSLLLQTDEPSWLCSLRAGATTVWERWNSYTRERGFGDVGMNSFNHYAYGAVAEWFFSGMAGIRPCEEVPGFERLILAPRPDLRREEEIPAGQKRITSADATYDSVRGRIESRWHFEEGKFVWSFTVPDGVTAEIELPLPWGGEQFALNGIEMTAEALGGKQAGKTAYFTLGAGTYLVREC
ncbi:MAG: alpha-rhamnosidase, partial [Clostridia bacterium]|nr:alpha-rhamnosidase [Clostridia bacterium]